MKKIIIFGAGKYGREALQFYGTDNVEYFCDNDENLWGNSIQGKQVISLDELKGVQSEYKVIIAIKNVDIVKEVGKQLKECNINFDVYTSDANKKISLEKAMEIPKFKEIRIETTNNCGCNCYMCPRDKLTRKLEIMPVQYLSEIVNKLSYIDYPIEFHMHGFGEALLCRDLPMRIEMVKKKTNFLPVIVTTLAYDIDEKWLESLLEKGLYRIDVSVYAYDKDDYKKIHGRDGFLFVQTNLCNLLKAKKKTNSNIDIQIKLEDFSVLPQNYENNHDKKTSFIEWLYKIGYGKENIKLMQLHNYGNHSTQMPKNDSDNICSIVWGHRKNILQIDCSGNVVPCCFDINSDYIWGNIVNQSLEEIFSSQERYKFLSAIADKKYIHMCDGCCQ